MNIYDALLNHNIRLSNGDTWLVIDELYIRSGEFVVYQRLPYARHTTEEYRGTDEDMALRILMGKDIEDDQADNEDNLT